MRGDRGWISQAVQACAGSAAAYEGALLLAVDAALERTLIECCRARYALLDGLLLLLGRDGADAQALRASLPKPPITNSGYRSLSDALAAASTLDRQLWGHISRLVDYGAVGALAARDRPCAA
jgi:hypothetical protein